MKQSRLLLLETIQTQAYSKIPINSARGPFEAGLMETDSNKHKRSFEWRQLTLHSEAKARWAYAGSLMSWGQAGNPETFWRVASHNGFALRDSRKLRKSLELREIFSKSPG